jgi:peptidoglycan/xylan/chitin deacetylase (PgdA/CDA1 family)
MNMVQRAKLAALEASRRCSLFRIAAGTRWRDERLLILCYHGVSLEDEHLWQPTTYISCGDLEARLRHLKDERYNVLSLEEAMRGLSKGTLPSRSVVLTFDDGFYDFRERAWPLLRAFGFPATLYLTTYYSMYNRPIFRLTASYMLWRSRQKTVGPDPGIGILEPMTLRTRLERSKVIRLLSEFVEQRDFSGRDKDALLERLARLLGFDFEWLLRRRILHLLKPEEVSRLAAEGLDVQLHAHRHRLPADRELLRQEIEENRKRITEYTGKRPVHFCYPNGRFNFSVLPWLNEFQVETATTCITGFASAQSNRLLLPRYVDGSDKGVTEVAGWLSGFTPRVLFRGEPAHMREAGPATPVEV